MRDQGDIIELVTDQLLEQFRHTLPRLNHVAIFLPSNSAAQDLRARLLKKSQVLGYSALLSPWIGTLKDWINSHITLPDPERTIISEQTRRLLFIEALEQHPDLFNEENKWQVSLALLKLFDELNLHHSRINQSPDEWLNTVQHAYSIDHHHAQLQQEAKLIHTLWHAWYKQLQTDNLLDESSAYVLRLHEAKNQLTDDFICYCLSSTQLPPCEKQFIQSLEKNQRCIDIKQPSSASNYTQQFLHYAFAYDESPIRARAENFTSQIGRQPLPFSIFPARSSEEEACAIDLQIRQWLISGKKSIGIISEDRKLSRRLRALLERANVPMQDISGWSLATTSAAATLERWLECIEEDFDYRPMLDFLKSHFTQLDSNHEEQLSNVYRLEKDIIQHEGIARNLTRYKKHLHFRLSRLKHWPQNAYNSVTSLLDQLEQSSKPLLQLYTSEYGNPLNIYLDALSLNLEQLGLKQTFSQDPAGIRILQTLSDMKHSLSVSNPVLGWDDFRTWLGLSLEEHMFNPQTESSPVQLMTLEQAQLRHFDALVIAAADRQFMPGSPASSPFFNQGARKALGLTTWDEKSQQRLNYFKRLLGNSRAALITYKSENEGEAIPPSSWLEAINNFHHLCFSQSLENTTLAALLPTQCGVMICDTDDLPDQTSQAMPNAPDDLSPDHLSAGAHQRLINCPYQFFAGDMLKLKPADEISEELKKSDYGERVHLALQAFHRQVNNLPAAFTKPVTEDNRDQAIEHLRTISSFVFNQDLEDNILHRGWLNRWLQHIPSYIDWQIQQQKTWSVIHTEERLQYEIDNTTDIFGRLDRVDRNNNEHCIIDYKTGSSASQNDIDSGENIQLTTYALLDEAATNIIYLILDDPKHKIKEGASLSGETLETLKAEVLLRLKSILGMIQQNRELPAWGDVTTCGYCQFDGLCRRDTLENPTTEQP